MTAAQRAPDPYRRRAEAERLGLQWPEPRVKRGRGPPTFKEKFREAVYQAIRGQKWDVLEQLENAEMHPGWRPGSPLVGSPAGMVAGMAVAEQLAPKEHEEAAPEEEHEEACLDEGDITDMEACLDEGDMETPIKRYKVHVDRHYQVWFLQWAKFDCCRTCAKDEGGPNGQLPDPSPCLLYGSASAKDFAAVAKKK